MYVDFRSAFLSLILLLPVTALASPEIQHWKTPEGARVYFVESHDLPILDVRVMFDAGSARDEGKSGLASLTANLLTEGAGEMDADTIAARLEGVGADLEAHATLDYAYVALRTLTHADKLKTATAVLQTVLAKPRFTEKDWAREKQRALAALRQREEDPAEVARLKFYQALYGDHPYAQPTAGWSRTVDGLTRDDAIQFHRRHYHVQAAVVILVGDLDRAAAESLAQRLVAGLPRGEAPAPLPPVPTAGKEQTVHAEFPSAQTHILVGMPVLSRDDPDLFPLYVGNHILGGGGLVSRLFEEVREKRGLSYSASSYFYPQRQPGPFVISVQTRNEQAGESLKVLRQTVADFVQNGPSAKELDAAQKNLTGGFVLRLDSNAKISEYVSVIGYYELPLDYLETYIAKVQAVTREQILDAFRRRVRPAEFTTVTVGPTAVQVP